MCFLRLASSGQHAEERDDQAEYRENAGSRSGVSSLRPDHTETRDQRCENVAALLLDLDLQYPG